MKKKVRYISLLLAFAMLLLPVSVFAEAPAGTFFIEPGKAAQNEDGSYSFPELKLSGEQIFGVQISFADQMRPGDGLISPQSLPEGISANEMLTSHAMLSFDVDPQLADTAAVEAFLRNLCFTKGEETEQLQVYFDVSGEALYRQVFYYAADDKYFEIFYSPCCALPVRHMDRETIVETEGVYPVVRGYSERLGQLAQYVTYRGMQGRPARIPDEATDNFLWEIQEFGATFGAIHTDDGWYWMDEKGEPSEDKVEYERIAQTEARYGPYIHYSINLQKQDDGRHGIRSAPGNHQCSGYLIEYDSSLPAQEQETLAPFASAVGIVSSENLLWIGWVAVGALALAGLIWAICAKQKRKKQLAGESK